MSSSRWLTHPYSGLTKHTSEVDRKRANTRQKGTSSMMGNSGGWRCHPVTCGTSRECVSKAEAVQLAKSEHAKLHMGRDLIGHSFSTNLQPHARHIHNDGNLGLWTLQNFGSTHLHALLAPITRRRPFELFVATTFPCPQERWIFKNRPLRRCLSQRLFAFKCNLPLGKIL